RCGSSEGLFPLTLHPPQCCYGGRASLSFVDGETRLLTSYFGPRTSHLGPRKGWPEVEYACLSVEKPLTGLIEFLQHVKEIKPLVLAKTILTVRGNRLD